MNTVELHILDLLKSATTADEKQSVFEEVYEAFFDKVYKFVSYKVDADEVDDISSEIFFKIYKAIPSFNPTKVPLGVWIFRIARNAIIDHYRKNNTQTVSLDETEDYMIPASGDDSDPRELTINKLDSEELKVFVNKLKPDYKQVIVLRFVMNMSGEEVADIMQKSHSSVRVMQYRALKDLKKMMDLAS